MQLFLYPAKGSYLIINCKAQIILEKIKVDELWMSIVKIWFKEDKEDPNILIMKVFPTIYYYWATEGNKMTNFIKMVASVVTVTNLINGEEESTTL